MRWEYREILVEREKDIFRPNRVNGQDLKDWQQGPAIHEYLNQLGEEGWELVTVLHRADLSSFVPLSYTLKRAKP